MKRISECFNSLKKQNKKALIPYITAGDPNLELTLSLMKLLTHCGADIIELGVPFSEPVADGLTIQKAHERALQNATNISQIFELVTKFREEDHTTPILLMTYLNPIETMGYERFAKLALKARVDGVLIVDLPPEESAEIHPVLTKCGLDCIYLASPNTSDERLSLIQQYCQGYLYYVSLKGVTGSNTLDIANIKERVEHIRHSIKLPICVGFGINDAKTAKEISYVADGVIIGSALVKYIEKNLNYPDRMLEQIETFVRGLRRSLDENKSFS